MKFFRMDCETTEKEECVEVPGPEVCETVYDEECSKVPFEDCKVNDFNPFPL